MWQTESVGARIYLVSAWEATTRVEEPKRERSQFRNESRRTDSRREVLFVARKRASELAGEWLKQMAEEVEGEQGGKERGVFDDRTARSTVLLQMALASVESDPHAAAQLANESLQDGVSFGFQNVLIALQAKNFDLAQAVFRRALTRLRVKGNAEPDELFTLHSYLYTPGRTIAPNTSENRGSFQLTVRRDPTRIEAAAKLSPSLAREYLQLAVELLLNSPLPSTTPDPQRAARAQASIINFLSPRVSEQMPQHEVLLQQRLASLLGDARFSDAPRPENSLVPRNEESQEEYAARRVDVLEEAARKEPSGLSRDIAYAKVALATDAANHGRGRSLAGNISDETLRADITNWLLYRATLHFIKQDDLDEAYNLNGKNTDTTQRAASLVIGAQKLVKTKDTLRASDWLREAMKLITAVDADEGMVRVGFGAVTAYGEFDKLAALDALSDAIKLLNRSKIVALENEKAPDTRRFSGFVVSDPTYGTVGFGLQPAVKGFPAAQFEQVLARLEQIERPELRGTAILELCRAHLQKKPSRNVNSLQM